MLFRQDVWIDMSETEATDGRQRGQSIISAVMQVVEKMCIRCFKLKKIHTNKKNLDHCRF